MLIPLLLLSGCRWDTEVRPDDSPWGYTDPAVVGFDRSALLDLDSTVKSGSFGEISSILILKDDKLVYENYYLGNSRDSLQPVSSIGNSIISLLVGFAIDDGHLVSVEDSIYLYLDEYMRSFNSDPLKKGITFRHLLTMRSGLSWNETLTSPFSSVNDYNIVKNQVPDRVAYLLAKPMESQAGQRYSQNSAAPLLIVKAIESRLTVSIEEYLLQKLFQPLGIEEWQLEYDEAGLANIAFGLSLKPLDLLKVGYFAMQQGAWDGQRLLDAGWLPLATDIHYRIDSFIDMGFLWWRFSDESGWPALFPQNDVFYSTTDDGQYLFILPSLKMVMVLTTPEGNTGGNIGYYVLSNYLLLPLQPN